MAPDTVAPPSPATDPARKQQWQLPAFAAGLVAAMAAWVAFPPQPSDPAAGFRKHLAALKKQLDAKPVDVVAVDDAAKRVAPLVDRFPDDATRARFYLGSARVLAAELGSPTNAAECWAEANKHFAACEPTKLGEKADIIRYNFRAAKAATAVGVGDPKLLVIALSTPPPNEDLGEGRRLLAEACLRMTPPDPKRARDELSGYLGSQHHAPPAAVARYKLKLAELSVALNEPQKAKQWLQEIGTAAPPDVMAVAKVHEARLAAAENKPAEAVRLFEEAQKIPGLPPEQKGLVLFETARGLQSLNNLPEARKYYLQARTANGAAGVAASVRLASLAARAPEPGPNPLQPADLLEGVVKPLKTPADFANPHVNMEELRATFEEVIQAGLARGDFEPTVRAAVAYTVVAPPGRAKLRQAETAAAWAEKLAIERNPTALEKFRTAATDFVAAAADQTDTALKGDLLRKAGDCFTRAGDTAAAREVLDRWANTPGIAAPVAAPALLAKADVLLTEGKFADGIAALKQVAAGGGVDALRANYRMGRAHLDEASKRLRANPPAPARKDAEALAETGRQLLGQIATNTGDGPGEREVRQFALYDLGRHQLGRDLLDAETRLRQLMQTNPTGKLADGGRLYLGTALLMRARGDAGGGTPADADKLLTEAAGLFEVLSKSEEPFYRAHGDLRLVNATLQLRKYDELPALCDTLSARYRDRPEELVILSMLYTGYGKANRPALADRTLARMTDVFARVPTAAYVGGMEELTQAYWMNWFDKARKRQ